MVLKSCCGCGHLKTGVMIIAILHLISWLLCFLTLLYITIVTATVTVTDENNDSMLMLYSMIRFSAVIFGYLLIPVFIELVIGVCFVYGVAKEKKYFILPVLITEMIELIAGTIFFIFDVVVTNDFEDLGYLLLIGFGAYIWYCNYSFYTMLSVRGKDAQFYSKMPTDKSFILTAKV